MGGRWRAALLLLVPSAGSAACALDGLDGLSGGGDDGGAPETSDAGTGGDGGGADSDGDAASTKDAADASDVSDVRESGSSGVITRGAATSLAVPNSGSTTFTVDAPPSAIGDVLLAVVALGRTNNPTPPVIAAPASFALVRRIDHGTSTTLATYVHVVVAVEPPTYTWTSDLAIEGVLSVAAYAGVDPASPIATDAAVEVASVSTVYASPSLSGVPPGARIVSSVATHAPSPTTWAAPPSTVVVLDLNNGSTRSLLVADATLASGGAAGPYTSTASSAQDYALTAVLALKPAP